MPYSQSPTANTTNIIFDNNSTCATLATGWKWHHKWGKVTESFSQNAFAIQFYDGFATSSMAPLHPTLVVPQKPVLQRLRNPLSWWFYVTLQTLTSTMMPSQLAFMAVSNSFFAVLQQSTSTALTFMTSQKATSKSFASTCIHYQYIIHYSTTNHFLKIPLQNAFWKYFYEKIWQCLKCFWECLLGWWKYLLDDENAFLDLEILCFRGFFDNFYFVIFRY